jgi:hypothetical protein
MIQSMGFDEALRARYAAMPEAELMAIAFDQSGDYTAAAIAAARTALAERGVDLNEVERARGAQAATAQRAAEEAAAARARVVAALEAAAERAARSLPTCPGCTTQEPTATAALTASGTGLGMRHRLPADALPPEIAASIEPLGRYDVRLAVPLCSACARRFAPGRPPRLIVWLIVWWIAIAAAMVPLMALAHRFETTLLGFMSLHRLERIGAAVSLLLGTLVALPLALRSSRRARRLAALHPFWPTLKAAAFAATPSADGHQ